MLSSRAVATTDGTTSLHSPVLVVVFADAAGFGAGDEHALASTIRPTRGTRENGERGCPPAADYTPVDSSRIAGCGRSPSPFAPRVRPSGLCSSADRRPAS